jgi:hypothetical protein
MMKKFYLLFLLLISMAAQSQDAVLKITKNYFRSDPFAAEFSSFLKHLLNDPTIKQKEVYQRTDTSLFFMHGVYTTHNPFFFKPRQVEITLTEIEIKYVDSLPDKDTIMVYQLVAISEDNIEGLKDIKREFEKLHNKFNKSFSKNSYQEQKAGNEVTAGWYNYFLATHAVAPISLLWGKTKGSNEAALNITIRMKSSYNRAVLAAPWIAGF